MAMNIDYTERLKPPEYPSTGHGEYLGYTWRVLHSQHGHPIHARLFPGVEYWVEFTHPSGFKNKMFVSDCHDRGDNDQNNKNIKDNTERIIRMLVEAEFLDDAG